MNRAHPQYPQLNQRYRQLREQLDAAYTAAVWDSQCIDRIAGQMLSVERALSSTRQAVSPRFGDGGVHVAPESFVRFSSL